MEDHYDVIIIGGGALGLGCAVDASSRGYTTLLLEGSDLAKGTSSKSTKLIHGGLRYLAQGNLFLVFEALLERSRLYNNAPSLVHKLPLLLPHYSWFDRLLYTLGLKVYDLLARGNDPSSHLSYEEAIKRAPLLKQEGLRGATLFYDGQFDDSRLAISLAQTAKKCGATIRTYTPVTELIHRDGTVVGVKCGEEELYGKSIINATGVFVDTIRELDALRHKPLVTPSQGVYIVLPRKFLKSETGIVLPKTKDGRLIFMLPWNGALLAGTTDRKVAKPTLEPLPIQREVSFILDHVANYTTKVPTQDDILSVFAGLRPLVTPKLRQKTRQISRSHFIEKAQSGLITVAGGKWTTYRKIAEDAVDIACKVGSLPNKACVTKALPLAPSVQGDLSKKLLPDYPYTEEDVIRAVRDEFALSVEDVLARRTRLLLLDAKASIQIAPHVAALMAKELGKNISWEKKEVKAYSEYAARYIP